MWKVVENKADKARITKVKIKKNKRYKNKRRNSLEN